MEIVSFESTEHDEIVDITPLIQDAIRASAQDDGICMVYCPHTTGGLFINENYDLDVKKDLLATYKNLTLKKEEYTHGEGNSDAHCIASLMGNSIMLIVEKGNLVLGKWQGIFFYEGDGPRKREVYIKTLEG